MTRPSFPRLAGAVVTFPALLAQAGSVTPVSKVTDLLNNLAKKIEKEGKSEAAAYDKFSCFCKEQSDNKLYAIEQSTDKIGHLNAEITKLGGEITELDTDIGTLGTNIQSKEGVMAGYKATRDTDHATFLSNKADAQKAIDAVESAIKALKDSKQALAGKAELYATAMAQVRDVAKAALVSHSVSLVGANVKSLQMLAMLEDPYTYKYQSNDIIATLESLRQIFEGRKEQLEADEFNAKTAFDKKHMADAKEVKFMKKDKQEKEEVRESKAEEKATAEADKEQETKEKDADQNFLNVVTQDCEEKAQLWDQRSHVRADELQAIQTAIDALKAGVAPNYKANKKLVGLQRKSTVKGHWVFVVDEQKPASFLQVKGVSLRGAAGGTDMQRSDRVHQLLLEAAGKLKSPLLSVAALKVRAAEDHFVKVRQIIKDLMAKLEEDATAEQTQKSFCDTQTQAAISRRDAEQLTVEQKEADISTKTEEKEGLKREIAELSAQIAANNKALAEQTTLRQEEAAENAATLRDAGVGKEQVEAAIEALRTFYSNHAFLQTSSSYEPWVATNSDREGNTVSDLAPEVFDSNYKGAQEASKGIIGLLEVILSDFDRTDTQVTNNENAAVSAYNTFEQTNTADTNQKQGDIDTKNARIATLDSELVTTRDELKAARDAHATSLSDLDNLHAMCVAGEETYEERVAKRQAEIEALKQAHDILEDFSR